MSGAMGAANLLKPMLGRGELRCIGATTLDEYKKYIKKDAALERRFQQVFCDQPCVKDTISILRGLCEWYELHHGVKISDGALVSAAILADRYITKRFLKDKAIHLADESATKLKMEITFKPTELDEIDRVVSKLEMERLSPPLKIELDEIDPVATKVGDDHRRYSHLMGHLNMVLDGLGASLLGRIDILWRWQYIYCELSTY